MKLPNLNDTICALATAPGQAALAVIRVSGPQSFPIGNRVCNRPIDRSSRNRDVFFRQLLSLSGQEIDQAIVTTFRAPHSFTGQDTVEFSLHGSQAVVDQVLSELHEAGCRFAGPGEFSLRAFWNGKMTLDQAEGIASLIAAHDEASRKSAIRVLEGEVGKSVHRISDQIETITGKLELSLDFSEEDVPLFPKKQLQSEIGATKKQIDELLAVRKQTRFHGDGIRIAIIGPPNAGKSSLLNRLLATEKAIVSPIPGTTRDMVEGELLLAGRRVKLIDTAGLRDTKSLVEHEGVRRTRALHRAADLIFWVHTDETGREELPIESRPHSRSQEVWQLINKIDLLDSHQLATLRRHEGARSKSTHIPVRLISAKTGKGIRKLRQEMEEWVKQRSNVPETAVPINERHEKVLRSVRSSLTHAIQRLERNEYPEFVAEELQVALQRLGEITGKTSTENVINKIFTSFCIGK